MADDIFSMDQDTIDSLNLNDPDASLAALERLRQRRNQQIMQEQMNTGSDFGTVLSDIGVGIGNSIAGRNASEAIQRQQAGRRAESEQRLKALQNQQSQENSLTLGLSRLLEQRRAKEESERFQKELLNMKMSGTEKDPVAQALMESRLAEIQDKKSERARLKTPEGRLERMSGEKAQKVSFIGSALGNIDKYEDAFNRGERQSYVNPNTPVIGALISSTPIDESRTNLEESIGRLASGGAINSSEEARFRRMIPTAADNDVAAKRKISQLRAEFEAKSKAFGFSPQDLETIGVKPSTQGMNVGSMASSGGDTKVIGGKTYVKVPGGWQAQ